jgi:hypothetical protein
VAVPPPPPDLQPPSLPPPQDQDLETEPSRRIVTRSSMEPSSPVVVKIENEESMVMDVDSSDNDYEVVLDRDGDDSSWSHDEDDENEYTKESQKFSAASTLVVDKQTSKPQRQYVSRRKGYLSCPLCDFDVKVKFSSKTMNPMRARGSHQAQKRLHSHFLYLHVGIKRRDAEKTKNGLYFYPCKFCDYQSNVNNDIPLDQSYNKHYRARMRLSKHVYDLHREELKGKLNFQDKHNRHFKKCYKLLKMFIR